VRPDGCRGAAILKIQTVWPINQTEYVEWLVTHRSNWNTDMKVLLPNRLAAALRWGASIVLWTGLVVLGPGTAAPCVAADGMPADLTELPLEALMEIEITSLSKKSQTLAEAPAAVFVITQEDIRRSGALTIPEVLRMVPGLQVARITASQWAITARGFNGRFGNKLLVLMDGRAFTPRFFQAFFGRCRIPCWKTWSASKSSGDRGPVCGAPMPSTG
jgi:hypothetical protein